MTFALDLIRDNPNGWGAISTNSQDILPDFLRDFPFLIHPKGDRVSKVVDWTQNAIRGGRNQSEGDSESDFHLVEGRNRKSQVRGHSRIFNRATHQVNQRQGSYTRGYYNQRGRNNRGRTNRRHDNRRLDASISINPEWGEPVAIFEFSQLMKLKVQNKNDNLSLESARNAGEHGKMYFMEWNNKKVSVKDPLPLKRTEKQFNFVPVLGDKILEDIESAGEAEVFMSDTIFSALMVCFRSVYSWDLEIRKVNGHVWFERRKNSHFDFIYANENATEFPDNNDPCPLNTPNSLKNESMLIQRCFSQQILGKEVHKLSSKSPFPTNDNAASLGYFYRILNLNEKVRIAIRCTSDAVVKTDKGIEKILVKFLNEYDPKITGDWRKILENQHGGVFAMETKNNLYKVQRWIIQAKLVPCSQIFLGFISRQNNKDNNNHAILATEKHYPDELISHLNIDLNHLWVIFKHILEQILEIEDGRYLLYKEPIAQYLKLYKIPKTDNIEDYKSGLQILK